jgi:hypothetical protein
MIAFHFIEGPMKLQRQTRSVRACAACGTSRRRVDNAAPLGHGRRAGWTGTLGHSGARTASGGHVCCLAAFRHYLARPCTPKSTFATRSANDARSVALAVWGAAGH